MSKDIKMFNVCDHIINGEYYGNTYCPRCYGKNYYYDMCFDNEGKIITASGDIKLQQEVLKIMNDKKGGNIFFPEWGNIIASGEVIGTKNLETTSQKLKMIIYETLQHLKNVQINNQLIFNNMMENEIIEEIDEISVISMPPLGYKIGVKFKNVVGEIYEQVIQI